MLDLVLLVLLHGGLFAVCGVAVRLQLAITGGFDLSVAAAIVIAAEVFTAVARAATGSMSYVVSTATCAAVAAACAFMLLWNSVVVRTPRLLASASSILVTSLGVTTAVAAAVILVRGPGLLQSSLNEAGTIDAGGASIGASSVFIVTSTFTALALFALSVRSRAAFAITLIVQNRTFAQEVGVDVRRVCVAAATLSGILTAAVGAGLAFHNGSTPEFGLPMFLYGAGAATIFSRPTFLYTCLGGLVIGGAYVAAHYLISPLWAAAAIFGLSALVVTLRGSSRVLQGVR